MALPPLIYETIVSPIEQAGDYFIMDSEQLISNPYRDMQKHYLDNAERRASLSERLINVRNKISNNNFFNTKQRLDKAESSSLRGMHEASSKLRYHVKLLDLDRRKHRVEINKRLKPQKDYSYDDQQLETSEKRLGVTGACYYLEKSLRYPVRHSSLQDTVSPTLARARKTLQRCKFEMTSGSPALSNREPVSRGSSRRQLSSARLHTQQSQHQHHIRKHSRLSHSAGSGTTPVRTWGFLTEPPDSAASVKSRQQGEHETNQVNYDQPQGSAGKLHRGQSGHKVKFTVPKKNKRYAKLDAHILARSKTFCGVQTKPELRSCYLLDSDDEEPPPHKVNLRELFYGKSNVTQSRPSTHASTAGRLKRSTHNSVPGHLTQEMMEKESAMIQRKINAFLNQVDTWVPTITFDSDSSSEEEEVVPAPKVPQAHVTAFSRHFLSQMAANNKSDEEDNEPFSTPRAEELKEDNDSDDGITEEKVNSGENKEIQDETKENTLDKWKGTAWRVTKPGASTRRLSTEDLILQRIMGVHVSTDMKKQHRLPLNSASRALRHTPTFKMQKVVEDLMASRTKFQQFEVDTLKRKLESGMDLSELEKESEKTKDAKPVPNFNDQLSEVSEEEDETETQQKVNQLLLKSVKTGSNVPQSNTFI